MCGDDAVLAQARRKRLLDRRSSIGKCFRIVIVAQHNLDGESVISGDVALGRH